MAITIHTGRSGRSQRDIIQVVSDITGGDLSEVTAVGYGVTVTDAVGLEFLRLLERHESRGTDAEPADENPDDEGTEEDGSAIPEDTAGPDDEPELNAETEPESAPEGAAKRRGRRRSGGQ